MAAKLSQEKLSELADCHPTYIGQLERGEKNATLESVWKISSALGIPLSKLFDKIPIQNPSESECDIDSIPLKCYELIFEKTISEQKWIYNFLTEIERYKNL